MEAGVRLQPSGQREDGLKTPGQEQEADSEVPAPRPDTLRTLRIRVSRAAPPAPPGGRLWHGFAVLRPPLRRAGRGLTFGRLDDLEMNPMQSLLAMDRGGMERKSAAPTFFTECTLAAFLAVSDRTIRNWIRRGELPSYKFGAARRIDPADVEDFLARHRDDAS
jgi:excisionase family DNA binding protein